MQGGRKVIEPLSIIAEFSIGLAGFAGIIAAVRRDSDPVLQFRFAILLVTAFTPGFFSLLTISLDYLAVAQSTNVRISSGLLFIYLGLFILSAYLKLPRGLPVAMVVFMFVAVMVNMILQGINVAQLSPNAFGLYLSGLVIFLLQGAAVFSILAITALRASD